MFQFITINDIIMDQLVSVTNITFSEHRPMYAMLVYGLVTVMYDRLDINSHELLSINTLMSNNTGILSIVL